MDNLITASPLCWPEGWKRTRKAMDSKFAPRSIRMSVDYVLHELRLLGVNTETVIVSTDLRLKKDGLPYSSQPEPGDSGVAVWWVDPNRYQKVIALDKYSKLVDNIYAIGKTISAMRGIERWGSGEILSRTFTGFVALPAPDSFSNELSNTGFKVPGISIQKKHWSEVLGCSRHSDVHIIRERYKKLRFDHHPDRGGATSNYHQICEAYAQALRDWDSL